MCNQILTFPSSRFLPLVHLPSIYNHPPPYVTSILFVFLSMPVSSSSILSFHSYPSFYIYLSSCHDSCSLRPPLASPTILLSIPQLHLYLLVHLHVINSISTYLTSPVPPHPFPYSSITTTSSFSLLLSFINKLSFNQLFSKQFKEVPAWAK